MNNKIKTTIGVLLVSLSIVMYKIAILLLLLGIPAILIIKYYNKHKENGNWKKWN